MKKYYTIFLGKRLWVDCIDDMNSGEIWAMGGIIWDDRKKAEACMKNLKEDIYGFETKYIKFKIIKINL